MTHVHPKQHANQRIDSYISNFSVPPCPFAFSVAVAPQVVGLLRRFFSQFSSESRARSEDPFQSKFCHSCRAKLRVTDDFFLASNDGA